MVTPVAIICTSDSEDLSSDSDIALPIERPRPPRREPTRVRDLWWDDGNLVIEAGKKLLRVYKGQLSSRSCVLAHEISCLPRRRGRKIDGCPVLHLSEDETEMEAFLRALLDYASFTSEGLATSKVNQQSCSEVIGVLRLSHKYKVNHLCQRTMSRLIICFPTTLDAYISRESRLSFTYDSHNYADICSLVSVAKAMDAAWLLPAAYYVLTWRFELHEVINDVFGYKPDTVAKDSYLQGANKQLFSYLRTLKFLSHRPDCNSTTKCSDARLQCLTDIGFWENSGTTYDWANPLGVWNENWDDLKVCRACKTSAKADYKAAKMDFWTTLPKMYGLPSWKELETKRKRFMGEGEEENPEDEDDGDTLWVDDL